MVGREEKERKRIDWIEIKKEDWKIIEKRERVIKRIKWEWKWKWEDRENKQYNSV